MSLRLDPTNPEHRKLLERCKVDYPKLLKEGFMDGERRAQKVLKKLAKKIKRPRPQEREYYKTDKTMSFVFPYPPSTNNLYLTTKSGKRVLTAEGREYKRSNVYLARQQGAFVMPGLISFTMHVYRPRRRGDLSNRVKIAEDSLRGVAYHDDEQVGELHLYRHLSRTNPRIEVYIKQIK